MALNMGCEIPGAFLLPSARERAAGWDLSSWGC